LWPLCRQFFFDIQILIKNPYIEEELTTQWPKDTKGLNPNPYIEEELTTQWPKDTKGVNQNPYWYHLTIVSSALL
jgi:hypothetical protein